MVRQAHHDRQEPDHPELAEGDILSLSKDRLGSIYKVIWIVFILESLCSPRLRGEITIAH
jgi:hypothetical protein